MNQDLVQLPNEDLEKLKAQIAQLQKELDEVVNKVEVFESVLRAALMDVIIEEQELTVLYKQQKELKKEKRLEQKRRGKNYVAPIGLVPVNQTEKTKENPTEKQERKRLYREAMMQVHPDRFSMREGEVEEATEVTTKLIDIYQNGDLQELQEFHAYIVQGLHFKTDPNNNPISGDTYLLKEIQRLKEKITIEKNRYTYTVLTTYADPNLFLDELKVYYEDRIKKLRKRTRT